MFKIGACLWLVVILVCVREGYTIKCYDCNSHNDTRCADEQVPEDFLVQCPEKNKVTHKDYILCRKIKQSIEFDVNGLGPDVRIIRSCGFEEGSYKNKCYQRSGFGGRQEVCACDQDACNDGNRMFTSIFLILNLLILVISFS